MTKSIFNFSAKANEIVFWISISFILLLLALALDPILTGDGGYYFAMLKGLATNASPAITDSMQSLGLNRASNELLRRYDIIAFNGNNYASHFFAYSLICLPAYFLLEFAGMETLKAFQITNALLITFALFYLLLISRQKTATKWFTSAGFLFSTATIYFQWTHTEVFSASILLISVIAFLDRKYVLASLISAIAALQNPSIILFVLPIMMGQSLELYQGDFRNLLSRKALIMLGRTGASSLIALTPYVWNYFYLGHPSIILKMGFIDYSLISPLRLFSFIFDLNQGLIIGLPLLLWSTPFSVILRITEAIKNRNLGFRREDLLLLGFLLIVIPTLGQKNWNPGHSIFLRYASWAGMVPLVWTAITIARQPMKRCVFGLIPAIVLQFAMVLFIGGIALPRFPSSMQFQPWVAPIWNFNPHLYNPVPEIYFERLIHRDRDDGKIPTRPVVVKGYQGEILKVLTYADNLSEAIEEVCGENGDLKPIDNRITSSLKFISTEQGYHYLTGRLVCYSMFRLPDLKEFQL